MTQIETHQFTNHVVYGANDLDLDLAGHSIAQIEVALCDLIGMEPGAEAYVDGEKVQNTFIVQEGQRVEFMKERGKKGAMSKDDRLWLSKRLDNLEQRLDSVLSKPIETDTEPESTNEYPTKPRWDAAERKLLVGGTVVKRYQQPAETQTLILAAFEEEGWPKRIYDPLPVAPKPTGHSGKPDVGDKVAKQRLRVTVAALNNHHAVKNIIRFAMDGTGQGVTWSLVE